MSEREPDDRRAGKRDDYREQEEQEPGRERRIGSDPELAEKVHEHCLADSESVDREWDEHREEEKRPEHVVRPGRHVYPDRSPDEPDAKDPRSLDENTHRGGFDEYSSMVAVAVKTVVDRGRDRLSTEAA
jgi:hypothetical protein